MNGDVVEWVKDKDGNMEPVWTEPRSVGFLISTKAVSSDKRADVTGSYKYTDGSKLERASNRRAIEFRYSRNISTDLPPLCCLVQLV